MSVIKRSGPELKYMLPGHQQEFEQDVLMLYIRTASDEDAEFNGVPLIEDLMYGEPKFYYGMMLRIMSGAEDYFIEQTKGLSDPQINLQAVDFLERFEDHEEGKPYLECYQEDVESVLDFHKLSYYNVFSNPFTPLGFSLHINHMPLQRVW